MANIHTMRKVCPDNELREMYEIKLMSTIDIARKFGCSPGKVGYDLKRIGVQLRKGGPKGRFGKESNLWKGDKASYSAFHHRVYSVRGKPQLCEKCQTTTGKMNWCNVTGNYSDVNDYIRLCISCHRRMDQDRRIKTRKMTSLNGSSDGNFRHSHAAKLTEEQVYEIKELRKTGMTYKSIGLKYGFTGECIWRIVTGKTWKHLER